MSISMPSRAHHVSALLSGVALVLGSVLVAAPAPASADAAPAAAAVPTVTTPSTPSQHWNYSFTYPWGTRAPRTSGTDSTPASPAGSRSPAPRPCSRRWVTWCRSP